MVQSHRRRLGRRFFEQGACEVARGLLGARLVCGERSGLIVETEAYLGPEDAASHARFGNKGRSAIMFGPAGFAYVYLIYGMHHMFNVVTGARDCGEAVLVRALSFDDEAPAVGAGPGKLSRHLGITVAAHNGRDLQSDPQLWIERAVATATPAIASGPRTGVDYAGPWAHEALRFWIADHPAVSRSR